MMGSKSEISDELIDIYLNYEPEITDYDLDYVEVLGRTIKRIERYYIISRFKEEAEKAGIFDKLPVYVREVIEGAIEEPYANNLDKATFWIGRYLSLPKHGEERKLQEEVKRIYTPIRKVMDRRFVYLNKISFGFSSLAKRSNLEEAEKTLFEAYKKVDLNSVYNSRHSKAVDISEVPKMSKEIGHMIIEYLKRQKRPDVDSETIYAIIAKVGIEHNTTYSTAYSRAYQFKIKVARSKDKKIVVDTNYRPFNDFLSGENPHHKRYIIASKYVKNTIKSHARVFQGNIPNIITTLKKLYDYDDEQLEFLSKYAANLDSFLNITKSFKKTSEKTIGKAVLEWGKRQGVPYGKNYNQFHQDFHSQPHIIVSLAYIRNKSQMFYEILNYIETGVPPGYTDFDDVKDDFDYMVVRALASVDPDADPDERAIEIYTGKILPKIAEKATKPQKKYHFSEKAKKIIEKVYGRYYEDPDEIPRVRITAKISVYGSPEVTRRLAKLHRTSWKEKMRQQKELKAQTRSKADSMPEPEQKEKERSKTRKKPKPKSKTKRKRRKSVKSRTQEIKPQPLPSIDSSLPRAEQKRNEINDKSEHMSYNNDVVKKVPKNILEKIDNDSFYPDVYSFIARSQIGKLAKEISTPSKYNTKTLHDNMLKRYEVLSVVTGSGLLSLKNKKGRTSIIKQLSDYKRRGIRVVPDVDVRADGSEYPMMITLAAISQSKADIAKITPEDYKKIKEETEKLQRALLFRGSLGKILEVTTLVDLGYIVAYEQGDYEVDEDGIKSHCIGEKGFTVVERVTRRNLGMRKGLAKKTARIIKFYHRPKEAVKHLASDELFLWYTMEKTDITMNQKLDEWEKQEKIESLAKTVMTEYIKRIMSA